MSLTPADPTRCQTFITPAHGPFMFGPRPKPERCKNTPVVIATENQPGEDGEVGSMSLCQDCLVRFREKTPRDYATIVPIPAAHNED